MPYRQLVGVRFRISFEVVPTNMSSPFRSLLLFERLPFILSPSVMLLPWYVELRGPNEGITEFILGY